MSRSETDTVNETSCSVVMTSCWTTSWSYNLWDQYIKSGTVFNEFLCKRMLMVLGPIVRTSGFIKGTKRDSWVGRKKQAFRSQGVGRWSSSSAESGWIDSSPTLSWILALTTVLGAFALHTYSRLEDDFWRPTSDVLSRASFTLGTCTLFSWEHSQLSLVIDDSSRRCTYLFLRLCTISEEWFHI